MIVLRSYNMSGFLISIIFSLVFFVGKLAFNTYNLFNKKQIYNNTVSKFISDLSFVFYLLVLIALVLSLRMAGDYGDGEVNLTLIVVAVVAALYIVENAGKYAKNRDYLVVESNFYNFKSLIKKEEFKDVLLPLGIGFYFVRKENFNLLKAKLDDEQMSKRSVKSIAINALKDTLPILLCVIILVVGLVRAV